jgi:hypothetical protein
MSVMHGSVIRLIVLAVLFAGQVSFGVAAPAKPLPKESAIERLSGVWELRADDGRVGRLILSPDGRLAASSTAGDRPLPDYEGHWYLLEEAGNRFVLEFGRERGGIDSYRVTWLFNCRDAFTLVETIKGGVAIRDQHRFIRVARTVAKPP